MDLSIFFVFELYYLREFMLKVLIQIQKNFKTIVEKVVKKFFIQYCFMIANV